MKKIHWVALATALLALLAPFMGTFTTSAQSAPAPQNLICDNTSATPLSGTYKNVRVRPGDSCYLLNARVTGGFQATRPVTVKILDTPVARNIQIHGATHDVIIGNRGCRFDPTVGNNIKVLNSHNVAICWMTVDNNIKVSGNDGRIALFHNKAGNNISITNNLAYNPNPGDGTHKNIDSIRVRHNRADGHITVRNNAGRPLKASDNVPAIRS